FLRDWGIFNRCSTTVSDFVPFTTATIVFFLPLPALEVTMVYNSPLDKQTSSMDSFSVIFCGYNNQSLACSR
ncbi:hypothetical protein VSP20_12980, partial [Myroides phaeus]|uniref:hypothetical protein n=1 Tax=Myroides phaeus TaxID=702745 RepID=UPI002DBDBF3D